MYLFKKKVLFSALLLLFGISMISNEAFAQQTPPTSKAPTLKGKVVDASSQQALNGIEVEIQSLDVSAKTDQKGMYTFDDLQPGTYTVTVSADGYQDWEKEVEVNEQGNALIIQLKPSAGK